MNVDIVYNPYRVSTSISIDGRPISVNSVLANYQTIEMANWGDRFFEDIRISANDSYSMTFLAPAPEARIMERWAHNSVCSNITVSLPDSLSDTTLERLDALGRIIAAKKQNVHVRASFRVYSDLTGDAVQELFSDLLPPVPFVNWDMAVCPINALDVDDDRPYFVICSDSRKAARVKVSESEAPGCMLVLASEEHFQHRGSCFMEQVPDMLSLRSRLADYLDMLVLETLLRDGLSQVSLQQDDEDYSTRFLLDKIEPTPLVRLPETIELGTDYELAADMLPAASPLCECTIQTSDARVIAAEGMKLSALALGKAMIRVYCGNDPTPIASQYIQVEKRIRIRSLDFYLPKAIRVGDTYDLSVHYEPANADNAHEIVYFSSNRGAVDIGANGTLLGVEEGTATITVMAGAAVMEKQLQVCPRLKKLKWDVPSKEALENTAVSARLTREPRNAILDDVVISVYPPSAGVYDERTGLLQVNHPGSITLTAQTRDGKVSESAYLEVKERIVPRKFPAWLKVLLLVLGLWLFTKILPRLLLR